MEHREAHFTNAQGLRIYTQRWSPVEEVKAILLLVHGLAEHSSRYEEFATYLVEHDFAVCTLDLPGHGKSEGTPGNIGRFDDYLETVNDYLEMIEREYPVKPIFLIGHSMGGLISSSFLVEHQQRFKGAILSAPAIQSPTPPSTLQTVMMKLLALLRPSMEIVALDSSGVSRDPQVVARYDADPLNYRGKVKAQLVVELMRAIQAIKKSAHKINLPMLFLHGEEDAMAVADGSRYLYESVSSTDKTINIYPELYHEILNEPEKQSVFSCISCWLNKVIEERNN